MSEERNLCVSCRRKECPDYKKFDGMIGPIIGCPKYQPESSIFTRFRVRLSKLLER